MIYKLFFSWVLKKSPQYTTNKKQLCNYTAIPWEPPTSFMAVSFTQESTTDIFFRILLVLMVLIAQFTLFLEQVSQLSQSRTCQPIRDLTMCLSVLKVYVLWKRIALSSHRSECVMDN